MKRNRILSMLLSAAMCLTCVPLTAVVNPSVVITATAAETTYQGLKYEVKDGEICITGYTDELPAEVVIPAEIEGMPVTSIGDFVFNDCTSLESITLPDSVTSIGEAAFQKCTSLINIKLPNNVTSIDDFVFSGCASLESITLPDSVTSIAMNAFQGCTSLTSIIIPDSVTSIGYRAFYNCSSLTSIAIPDSVTDIGEYAFFSCTSLASITIPDSVAFINNYAFSECTSLSDITIPDGVTRIGLCAFSDCTSLTSITIPDSVTSINRSFVGCTGLTSIEVTEGNTGFFDVDGVLFSKGIINLIQYPASKKNSTFSIPDGVIDIEGDAFSYCTNLTSITIPDSMTSIIYKFVACKNLTSITIPDSVTFISKNAFSDCENLAIKGYSGSYAETYANENNIPFEAIEAEPAETNGDVNDDGKFNVADVVLLQKWLLAVPDTHLANWKAADFCTDNKLNIFDLCLMKRELIRTTFTTYVEPDHRTTYGEPLYVLKDGLNLYLGPDGSYASIATLPEGTQLNELGYNDNNGNWLFTEYNGKYGWIRTYEDDNKTRTVEYLVQPDKPVIYLYPEKETDVHVELELTEADLSTTYPKYNNGWDVVAYPDGTLLNKADGSYHKYLFWDAVNCRTRFDFSKGFCVAGSDTESFLKEKLTYMGLTEQEMNEFIVYWLPRMEHNAYNLISFQGEAYMNSAKLTITPTPDSECRIFMAYVPLESAVEIEPQELATFVRKGFSVVEWGGAEIKTRNNA